MARQKSEYSRGRHPNTLATLLENSKNGGRPLAFNSPKKGRSVTMTDEGWEAIKLTAKEHGYKSISEFLERIARGELIVLSAEEQNLKSA